MWGLPSPGAVRDMTFEDKVDHIRRAPQRGGCAMIEFCAECRYFLAADLDPGQGLCRRYPAEVMVTKVRSNNPPEYRSVFPPMMASGWCGEFKLSDEARKRYDWDT